MQNYAKAIKYYVRIVMKSSIRSYTAVMPVRKLSKPCKVGIYTQQNQGPVIANQNRTMQIQMNIVLPTIYQELTVLAHLLYKRMFQYNNRP